MTSMRPIRAKRCANSLVPPMFEIELRSTVETLYSSTRTDYLRQEIFSKYVSSETDPPDVRRQRAINKWLATESINRSTNERLLTTDPEYQIIPRVSWQSFSDKLRSIIAAIIGDIPPADLHHQGGFSSGASTSRVRTKGHPSLKFVGEADITLRATDLVIDLLVEAPLWLRYGNLSLNVVAGNEMFTVPKNAEIDRCAAKEPDLNMYMQRGVGDFFRKRLYRHGIDLRDQSRNRNLAREGSITGNLCTLDLSSASDSITTGLCLEFLPIHWYRVLSDLRSPTTRLVDGSIHENEMFSSMGNGFTFELESLLFYSIARTVAYFEGISGVVSVYGDDIIAPTALAATLVDVLAYLGFSVNQEKSHIAGSFRESCGGHFDNGLDITPFYVKKPISHLTDLIEILNKIRKWSETPGIGVLDPTFYPLWEFGKSLVPTQLWGGHDLGSNTQLVTGDEPRMQLLPCATRRSTGIGGYIHRLSTQMRSDVSLSSRNIPKGTYEFRKCRTGHGLSPTPWCMIE